MGEVNEARSRQRAAVREVPAARREMADHQSDVLHEWVPDLHAALLELDDATVGLGGVVSKWMGR